MSECKNCKWFWDMTIFGKNRTGHCYYYPPHPQQIPIWSMKRPEVKGTDICSKFKKEKDTK